MSAWPRLASANDDTVDTANPWAVALFRTLKVTNPRSATEQAAYDKWLDRTADREEARSDRIHGAVGVIPGALWIVLLFITGVIFVFMLFFADRGERAVVQADDGRLVIAVIAATLLLIQFLDDPFRDGVGGLKPVAMERTQRILRRSAPRRRGHRRLPCDATAGRSRDERLSCSSLRHLAQTRAGTRARSQLHRVHLKETS